ncbi:uncharacterized protein LOC119686226 [Teleopsis dalmanni]|uniref:uncharacterized protein LOC119686226 n=1 Tax=Teleopsis dalmanni TaxID=139649 RepID=UPI0018CEA168|nr:uncharacterized protein LOC119686226 [Teleopsis dalmanni]
MPKQPTREKKVRKNPILPDWDELRKQVVPYTFVEARRLKIDIYDALTQELYENGSVMGGLLLSCLIMKEQKLYEGQAIHLRFKDKRKFLIEFFFNLRDGEGALATDREKGMEVCARNMYRIIKLFEANLRSYEWAFSDVLSYAFKMCLPFDGKMKNHENLVRVFYKFGRYFGEKCVHMDFCSTVLERAQVICRGEDWLSDEIINVEFDIFCSLHKDVAYATANLLISLGRQTEDAVEATSYGAKAVSAISEIGRYMHKAQYCRTTLDYVDILTNHNYLDDALASLSRIENDVRYFSDLEFDILWARFNYEKGRVYTYKNISELALKTLHIGLEKAHELNLNDLEIKGLKLVGENYGYLQDWRRARQTFDRARTLANEIGDTYSKTLMYFLSANLIKQQFMAHSKLLVKSRRRYNPIAFHIFTEWKFKSISFWHYYSVNDLKELMGNSDCIIDETRIYRRLRRTLSSRGTKSY